MERPVACYLCLGERVQTFSTAHLLTRNEEKIHLVLCIKFSKVLSNVYDKTE